MPVWREILKYGTYGILVSWGRETKYVTLTQVVGGQLETNYGLASTNKLAVHKATMKS